MGDYAGVLTTVLLVLAGWTLLSLPLALVVARLLAGPDRHHPAYVVGAGGLEQALSAEVQDQHVS